MATFWDWQQRALGWLLGWGIGSTVVGAGMATSKNDVLRQVGIQAASWGAIDAALALSGRAGARRKAPDQTEEAKEAERFQKIVAVNAGLDVLYMLGGWQLIRRADSNQSRRGMGLGILVQGGFLFVYDTTLVWAIGRWREQA